MPKNMKVRRYGFERKRKQKRRIITTVVMVLLVGAAAVIGWFAFDPLYEFVVNFELPSPGGQPPVDPAPDPGSQSPGSVDPAPPPEEVQEEVFPAITAYLPPERMAAGDLAATLAALKAQGVEGVVFDLKDAQGMVRYQSALSQVGANLAQAEDALDLTQTVAAIRQAGLVPVGRLFAFRDHIAPKHLYEGAVKYNHSNVNWINDSSANGGRPWLNPNHPDAQQYVLDLVGEAAGLGLDQLILDGVQFPQGVALHLATYGVAGEVNKSAVLAGFLTKAQALAQDKGITLWPVVNLLSAAGLSDVRYGTQVGLLLEATDRGVLEVMPDQFGTGVTGDNLTLSTPVLTPYETVKAALAASAPALGKGTYVAMVQAYTAPGLPDTANQPYTRTQVEDQMRAAREMGIPSALWYNPAGSYPQ